MNNCIFIGVAGGSGSGKTTVSHNLLKAFKAEEAVLVEQDAYYKELKDLSIEERAKVNFDHPDSIEFDLIKQHLIDLKNGKAIDRPIYDFKTHSRKEEKVRINPSRIVVIEGILIFSVPEIRDMLDVKIFVDTDADEMLLRRITRDINERGRTFDSVKTQYLKTVKPMFLDFCEPSKRYADVIMPRGGANKIAENLIIAKLKRYLYKGRLG